MKYARTPFFIPLDLTGLSRAGDGSKEVRRGFWLFLTAQRALEEILPERWNLIIYKIAPFLNLHV